MVGIFDSGRVELDTKKLCLGVFLHEINEKDEGSPHSEPKPYKHICLGGTFDRLVSS